MASKSNYNEIKITEGNKFDKNNLINVGERSDLEKGATIKNNVSQFPWSKLSKKVGAEAIGTFFLIFVGVGAAVIDRKTNGSVTLLGVSIAWGLMVTILIYSLGHISGAHFNPAVTLAFVTVRRFPLNDITWYIAAQLVGSITSAFLLRLLFGNINHMAATVPKGSDVQSLVLEFIITFLLMFVVCAVATDTRAIGQLAGLAIGATVVVAVIIAAPISGAALNPARSLGSAIAGNKYTSIWVYMVGPTLGAIAGAWSYEMIRLTDEPARVVTKSASFLASKASDAS